MRRVAVILMTFLLAGCFDLDQKVAINRDGSGVYEVAITADGMIGEGLKKETLIADAKGTIERETQVQNGHVVHRERVKFTQLSDLTLEDEDLALLVRGHSFFGFGPTEMTFRRTVRSADVEADQDPARDRSGERAALATLFGNHSYSFSVTLPGSIERIAPVKLGGIVVRPEVAGDFFHGYTVTWRMPLHMMFAEDTVTFEVDFSAYGTFTDAHSGAPGAGPAQHDTL